MKATAGDLVEGIRFIHLEKAFLKNSVNKSRTGARALDGAFPEAGAGLSTEGFPVRVFLSIPLPPPGLSYSTSPSEPLPLPLGSPRGCKEATVTCSHGAQGSDRRIQPG